MKELLDRQIEMNMGIADEGIASNYGACIGKTYLILIPNKNNQQSSCGS